MAITRLQLETATLDVMDATGAGRWGTTILRQALGHVHGRGWRKLLGANKTLRWAERSVTTDSNGRVAWSSLSSGSGDSAERAWKVLAAASGSIRYTPGDFMDNPLAATDDASRSVAYRVWRQGDSLQFTPAESGTSVTVWVNHLPTSHNSLSGDASVVVWPDDDYLLILAYEAASHLLMKGGAETEAAKLMQEKADALWPDLLSEVQRWSVEPVTMQAPDHPSIWGGV